MKFNQLLKNVCNAAGKHSPEILTGLGIAGFITAIVLAVKATPEAEDLITRAEDEKEDTLTPIETVKAAWKPYVPAAITAVASAGCVIGATKINNRRNTELATAYAISQAMVKRYQEKTAELAGEEKADEIDKEVKREIVREPEVQKAVAKLPSATGQGMRPFIDSLTRKAFNASPQMLINAEAALNRRMYTGLEPYITVSDMYDELNAQGVYPPFKHTAMSSMLGWTPDTGGIEFDLDVEGVPFEQDHWDDGTPCDVMGFKRYHTPVNIR